MSHPSNIALVEPSEIIAEGIHSLLKKSGRNFNTSWFNNFENLKHKIHQFDVIVINPILIYNIEEEWKKMLASKQRTLSIALIYEHFGDDTLALFNEKYSIDQSVSELIRLMQRTGKDLKKESEPKEYLSAREKEILKFLSQGKSIKEIADIVHLSPHTILTHRKNISLKTGIKTVAGLTVYAISLGLISIDEMNL